jgi:hypothetical protein
MQEGQRMQEDALATLTHWTILGLTDDGYLTKTGD